jgi:hypothetical protein
MLGLFSRRFVVDTLCVAGLFCIMTAFAKWQTLETADYLCIIYVHVLVCNILIECNSPIWMRLWRVHGERESLYALLGRVFFEFAACALLAVLMMRQ